jgi:pimeloyl-ACP methyl ester carboxylesterase
VYKLPIISILVLHVAIASLEAQTSRKMKGKVGRMAYSYRIMEPASTPRGIVVLMPSRGEKPKELFWHTSIPRHLAGQGFVTIVPDVNYALILESRTRNILNDVVAAESARAGLPESFVIGGFSSGGTVAAHYAEYLLSHGETGSVKGLFLIDPPLDLVRFYNAWTRLIESECPEVIISEGRFIKKYVEGITGGTPEAQPENYVRLSAFAATAPEGGNAASLRNVPIRLYTEPDLDAMQTKYCEDLTYENLNSSDLDRLATCLRKLGNDNVEYISTSGRGLHSWNIVDPEDLVRWVSVCVENR